MVTAKDVRFIVRKTWAVESKMGAAFVVGIRFTDSKMCGQCWKTKSTKCCNSAETETWKSIFNGAAVDILFTYVCKLGLQMLLFWKTSCPNSLGHCGVAIQGTVAQNATSPSFAYATAMGVLKHHEKCFAWGHIVKAIFVAKVRCNLETSLPICCIKIL